MISSLRNVIVLRLLVNIKNSGNLKKFQTGLEFSYTIKGETVHHTRSKATLSRSDFEKAVQLNPQKPSDLHNDVAGPSYVYAVISDPRLK